VRLKENRVTHAGRYRPELDGLRAVAVVLVVLYHAGIAGFSGGFIGVDVFFVLSGYFMTAIISREIDEGRFELSRFYVRRIRRLFPALAVVLIVTSVFAWALLMPQELKRFAASVRAAALLYANVQFERESGYFDLDAHMKPLLHTWSLSVEEQFYLIFPLALVLLSRRHAASVSRILLAFTALSFLLSAWGVFAEPTVAFYIMPYRLWELLLGALVALNPQAIRQGGANILTVVGLTGIVAAGLLFDNDTPFPGPAATLPCLSTVLLIAVGAQSSFAQRLLGSGPMLFLGRTSYSIYLWHWPIIVFLPYFLPKPWMAWAGPLAIAGSIVLGYISWKFVEQPFRYARPRASRRIVFGGFAGGLACAALFAGVVGNWDGLPGRIPAGAREFYAAKQDISPYYDDRCFMDSNGKGLDPAEVSVGNLCPIGTKGVPPTFLLWGDSHAAAIAPALDVAARKYGISGLFAGRASCPPLPDTVFGSANSVARCVKINDAVLALLKRQHFQAVFMAAYWPKYVHRAELPTQGIFFDVHKPLPLEDWSAPIASGLQTITSTLTDAHTLPVLIMDVPEMGFDVPEALARAQMTNGTLDIAPPLDYTMRRQALARRVLTEMATAQGAALVDPLPAICFDGRCHASLGDIVLYKDTDHLSNKGALAIASVFDPIMMRLAKGRAEAKNEALIKADAPLK
jgi:peptidoglycan/LPS O-acetylase OafA/YrhL